MNKETILKERFGYPAFREGQGEIIDQILLGQDTLGIMPTGAGKSICFQLPALMMDGITLVVSPLISLMKDQVHALIQSGIPAAYLNSSLTYLQYLRALSRARSGKYKIIYVAPERLESDEFISLAQDLDISMITIDEAHCVSQWGQDFRTSYVRIPQFIERFSNRPVLSAFTATATAKVRDDIIDKLKLQNPFVITTGFDRKNLHFSVRKPNEKFNDLKQIVQERKSESGIVYCATRKTVEEVCDKLNFYGFSATRYHAGLEDKERHANQEAFLEDRKPIMVATNAFGMGIDKSNITYVVHYNMPKNIESYYQEAGRAGRDGSEADCILLYAGQDVVTNQFLIDHSNENDELDEKQIEQVRKNDRELLKQMTFYCHTADCLRAYILRYFGEQAENYCGKCGNCNDNFIDVDITRDAQKILSCIKRCGERFGIQTIADTLRGSKNQKIQRLGLEHLSTYGIMKDVSSAQIRDMINYLQLHGYAEITQGEYPVLKLLPKARNVLFGSEKLSMRLVKAQEVPHSKQNLEDHYFDAELFDRLRNLRAKIAHGQSIPAYVVFSDATLKDMSAKMPVDKNSFLSVSGVGQAKLEKYGSAFLKEIAAYRDELYNFKGESER